MGLNWLSGEGMSAEGFNSPTSDSVKKRPL